MTWAPEIERWRPLVEEERRDVPIELILAVINSESGGVAGIKSRLPRPGLLLPSDAGKPVLCDRDLGLMQTGPSTILDYNRTAHEPATFEDMTRVDERAARQQIRVGAWLLAALASRLHAAFPGAFKSTSLSRASDDFIQMVLVAYGCGLNLNGSIGDAGLAPKLKALQAARKSLTWDNLKKANAGWQPLQGANAKWAGYKGARGKTSKPLAAIKEVISSNWIVIVMAVALWAAKKRGGEITKRRVIVNPKKIEVDDEEVDDEEVDDEEVDDEKVDDEEVDDA